MVESGSTEGLSRRGSGCFVGTGSLSHFPGHPDNKHQRPRREKAACLLHMKSHFVPLTMPGLFRATSSSCQRGGGRWLQTHWLPWASKRVFRMASSPTAGGLSPPAFKLAPGCLIYVPHFALLCPPAKSGGGGFCRGPGWPVGPCLESSPTTCLRPTPFAQSALAQRLYGGVICSDQAE